MNKLCKSIFHCFNNNFFFFILVNLYELKTYREVIDEIFYKVNHLEPWEKGSRKTAGQTGMCGGVSEYLQLKKMYTAILMMVTNF